MGGTAEPAWNVVLIEPEIPPNTGNIGRLCLAAGARLHLVKPLGFSLDDRALQRAGLDYWPQLDWRLWNSLDELAVAAGPAARFFYLTTKATRPYWDERFARGDHLVFGRETKGLPESLLEQNRDRCLRIPMDPRARSLNVATAVGIVLYEALRQTSGPPFGLPFGR
jgi:tRNA (cytidine/uridine-2'-O-)-methyltransferase